MDFASLTRPAVICHCRRCFSSLAVLENEWAAVSPFYATSTAWVSVDSDRISISSQRKRIPDHSDASLIRGRITQEASCRMCPSSSKLGVVVEMDNGPIFIWKMAKVSFREVVSMRPTEPVFKDGAIEKLLPPPPPPTEPLHSNRTSFQGDAPLIPAGSTDFRYLDPVMQHQMQHQGRSIDQISSSVNNLHDTMSDLKNSFTSLRIELNGPNRYGGDQNGVGFDMVATVLKELKSKSDEIEKLKLEIEALKLKARLAEDSKPRTPEYMAGLEGALPRMQSPDLLQAGRKRGWADTFSSRNPLGVADTFDEDDMDDDLSITGHAPVNGTEVALSELAQNHSTNRQWHIESGPQSMAVSSNTREKRDPHPAQSPAKRQRLAPYSGDPDFVPGKKKPGRPRKSDTQTDRLNTPINASNSTSSNAKRVADNKRSTLESTSNAQLVQRAPGRTRRNTVPESDATADHDAENDANLPEQNPSQKVGDGDVAIHDSPQATIELAGDGHANGNKPADNQTPSQAPTEPRKGTVPNSNGVTNSQKSPQGPTETQNGNQSQGDAVGAPKQPQLSNKASEESLEDQESTAGDSKNPRGKGGDGRKKRKASLAARDAMIRKEMQREEAMETEQIR